MPTTKDVYRFDKKLGCMVNVVTGKPSRFKPKPLGRGIKSKLRNCQAKYPYFSETMGVNPEDVPRAQEILRQNGVQTEYNADGNPKIESRGHLKKHGEALGFYMRNGGY